MRTTGATESVIAQRSWCHHRLSVVLRGPRSFSVLKSVTQLPATTTATRRFLTRERGALSLDCLSARRRFSAR